MEQEFPGPVNFNETTVFFDNMCTVEQNFLHPIHIS